MNSPNLMAASAVQRTKRVKLLIYGNLLPLHEPLRLAEELAMLDCLSNGRLISGFARGIPREYQVHNVALSESRARFEEAYDIITRAWTEDIFSYQGKFWSYRDVALWPRPVQRPYPEIWMPVVGSKESIEFAARHNIRITPGLSPGGLQDDIIRFYTKCLTANGHAITPDHLSLGVSVYVADSKAQAVKECGPYLLYFNRTLFSHGNFTETSIQRQFGYSTDASLDYVRPENRRAGEHAREEFRNTTMDAIERLAERLPWGLAPGSRRTHHRAGRPHRRQQRTDRLHARRVGGLTPSPAKGQYQAACLVSIFCAISVSAICTAFNAAPFLRLSATHQNDSPCGTVGSLRIRLTYTASSPAHSSGVA